MQWCKCLVWIPVRKALRLRKVLIKIPFIGNNVRMK